jgi:hypothetical protein
MILLVCTSLIPSDLVLQGQCHVYHTHWRLALRILYIEYAAGVILHLSVVHIEAY